MKKNLFVSAAIVAAMTACVPVVEVVEDVKQEEAKVWVEFSAGVQTKAAFEEKEGPITGKVVWETGDEININGEVFVIPEEEGAISEDGKKAKFKAQVEASFLSEDSFTAIYPATAVDENGNITISAISQGEAVIVAQAEVTSPSETLEFKHVTSYFMFQVPSEVSVVTISAIEALAGTVKNVVFGENEGKTTVSYELVTESAVEPTSETEDETETETETEAVPSVITVTLPENAKFQPETDYLVSVLPGEKNNLTVAFDGNVSKTWANPVNVKYAMIANMGVLPEPATTVYLKPSMEWETAVTEAGYAAVIAETSYPTTEVDVDGDEVLDGIYAVSVPLKSETIKFVVNDTDKITDALELPTTESNVYCVASQSWKTIEEAKAAKTQPTITLSLPETFTYGGSFELNYTVSPAEAAEYVEVNVEGATYENGVVSLTNVGDVTITLSIPETDFYAANAVTRTFTVSPAPRGLAFNPTLVTVTYGETITEPELTGEAAGVVYSSSNTAVATVDPETGVLTYGNTAGETTITAAAEANETHLAGSASYKFIVTKANRASAVGFSKSSDEMTYGTDATYTEPKLTNLLEGDVVSYAVTEGTDVVEVVAASGNITTKKAGTAKITATVTSDKYEDATASYTLTVKKVLYLVPNENWKQASARFAARFYEGDNEQWEDMIDSNSDGVYEVEVPSGFSKVIFCRMNPSTTENNWTNKWNQTGDLSIGDDLYCVIPFDVWDGVTVWSKTSTYDITSKIYLAPNSDWTSSNARFEAYFWGNGTEWVTMTQISSNPVYYEAKYSSGMTNVKFLRKDPSAPEHSFNDKTWNTSGDQNFGKNNCFTVTGWDNSGTWSKKQ